MKKILPWFMVAAIAAIAGCAGHKTIAMQEAENDHIYAQIEQKQEQRQQSKLEQVINKIPQWAIQPQRPDATGMYAVGAADSSSVRLAISQAKLRAEFGLAKMYKKELSGSERDFQQDSGQKNVRVKYESLIDELVRASIVGEEVIKLKTQAINGKAYAWVLMKLPYDEFNKVLKEQKIQSQSKTVRNAFDDLERRLDKRRQQRLTETKVQHEMAMDELKTRNNMLLSNQKASNVIILPTAKEKRVGRMEGHERQKSNATGVKTASQ